MDTKPATHRMIGTTNDVIDCDRCGKPDLRMTVVLEWLDEQGSGTGEVTYYGTTCAARALRDRGVKATAATVRADAEAAQVVREREAANSREMLAFLGVAVDEPVTGAVLDRVVPVWAEANRGWASTQTPAVVRARVAGSLARHQANITA